MFIRTQPSQQAVQVPHSRCGSFNLAGFVSACADTNWDIMAPQHFLYFLPLPQGHGSFRSGFMRSILKHWQTGR
jgi:hypothetical protein